MSPFHNECVYIVIDDSAKMKYKFSIDEKHLNVNDAVQVLFWQNAYKV